MINHIQVEVKRSEEPKVLRIKITKLRDPLIFYVDIKEEQVWNGSWGFMGKLSSFLTSRDESLLTLVGQLVYLHYSTMDQAEEVLEVVKDEIRKQCLIMATEDKNLRERFSYC